MEAYFEILGYQYKAYLNRYIYIPFLGKEKIGNSIYIKNIFFLKKEKLMILGNPIINNLKIKARIIKHFRSKKLIIFKKKRRKGYKLKKGHRQYLTQIKIISFEKK